MNAQKDIEIQKATKFGSAIIGALAGTAIGIVTADLLLLLTIGGITLGTMVMLTAGFAVGGLFFGASLGIIRNIFRQALDKTNLLFKDLFSNKKANPTPIRLAHEAEKPPEKPNYAITTIVYDTYTEYPQTDTYQRDKVLASARQALLSMDPTKAIPH